MQITDLAEVGRLMKEIFSTSGDACIMAMRQEAFLSDVPQVSMHACSLIPGLP